MLSAQQLRQVLPTVPRGAIRGPWYRAVAFDYLLRPPPGAAPGSGVNPLWPGGALLRGARFTPRQTRPRVPGTAAVGFESLYLAEDELTPILEIAGVLRPPNSPIPLFFDPQVLMTVDGVLTDIIDVTDGQVQNALGTNLQELTGIWVVAQASYLAGQGAMPPTQVLGQSAFDVGGIVGLRYPSSKSTSAAAAVVVFSDRLSGGQSYLQVFNRRSGSLTGRLP
jgi:RES domain